MFNILWGEKEEKKKQFLFVSIRLSCQDVGPNSDYPPACSDVSPLQGLAARAPAKVIVEPQRPTLRPSLLCAGLDHHQTTKHCITFFLHC